MTAAYPFPILWQKPLSWFFTPIHTPYLDGGSLTVRCGPCLLRLAQDGSEVWKLQINPRAGDGNFFIRAENMFLTDFHRQPDRLTTITGIGAEGTSCWQLDLPSILAPYGGAILVGDCLFAAAIEPEVGGVLYRIDIRRGATMSVWPLQWGADGLVHLRGERLLVRTQTASGDEPGLYAMNPDGSDTQIVEQESTWLLQRRGKFIFAVTRSSAAQKNHLRVFQADTLARLWSVPVMVDAADFGEDATYCVEELGGKPHIVARHVETGEVRWRTGPLTHPVVRIAVGGPIVLCAHLGGALMLRRTDGRLLGEVEGYWGRPTVRDQRLYVLADNVLLCASLGGILP